MGLLTVLFQAVPRWLGFEGMVTSAGEKRGDIRLPSNVLPDEIDGWQVVEFKEPQEGDVSGVIGWSHTWTLQKRQQQVLVAFDQVGFMGWHELTLCYQATGWTMVSRKVIRPNDESGQADWQYVSAVLRKTTGEQAVLLYSIFNGEGESVTPPDEGTVDRQSKLLDRFRSRNDSTGSHNLESSRCLQVQLLVPHQNSLQSELLTQVNNLHFSTRQIFRQHWQDRHSHAANTLARH